MPKAVKTPEQALESLMALCSKAERSSGDAMRLMFRWGVEPGARAGVLQKLVASRFIDDARYAAAYVRQKSTLDGWGIHKIRAGLAAKGIAKDIIERTAEEIDREKSHDRLEALIKNKMRTTRAATPYELRGKLVRFGISRGFGFDEVVPLVEKLVKADEE